MLAQDGPRSNCPKCHASALWLNASVAGLTLIIITCSCCGWNGYERQTVPERPDTPDPPAPALPIVRPNRSARGTRRLKGRPPKCHPDAKYMARGLCVKCYFRWYNGLDKPAKFLAPS